MPRHTLALLVGLAAATAARSDDYTPLWNGNDLSGWKVVAGEKNADPAKIFRVQDGELAVAGRPHGYLVTTKPYRNYALRFEWRFPRPDGLTDDTQFRGNAGVLIHIQEELVWPRCVKIQCMHLDPGDLFRIGKEVKFAAKLDKDAQKKATRPVGAWNLLEVAVRGGKVATRLNGVDVCSGEGDLAEGPIGLQSTGHAVFYRKIGIKSLE